MKTRSGFVINGTLISLHRYQRSDFCFVSRETIFFLRIWDFAPNTRKNRLNTSCDESNLYSQQKEFLIVSKIQQMEFICLEFLKSVLITCQNEIFMRKRAHFHETTTKTTIIELIMIMKPIKLVAAPRLSHIAAHLARNK